MRDRIRYDETVKAINTGTLIQTPKSSAPAGRQHLRELVNPNIQQAAPQVSGVSNWAECSNDSWLASCVPKWDIFSLFFFFLDSESLNSGPWECIFFFSWIVYKIINKAGCFFLHVFVCMYGAVGGCRRWQFLSQSYIGRRWAESRALSTEDSGPGVAGNGGWRLLSQHAPALGLTSYLRHKEVIIL